MRNEPGVAHRQHGGDHQGSAVLGAAAIIVMQVERSQPPIRLARRTSSGSPQSHVLYTPCTAGSSPGRPDRPGGMYPLRVGVTMSLHKLTAGSGYDYLTRQVAALDATEKGHTGLASYYTERGETPGVWIGSGMDGIDGLAAGDPVTAEQMRALFGCGLHPLAELRQQQLEGPDLTPRDFQEVARLGAPFKIVDGDRQPIPPRGGKTLRSDQDGGRPAGRRAAAGC